VKSGYFWRRADGQPKSPVGLPRSLPSRRESPAGGLRAPSPRFAALYQRSAESTTRISAARFGVDSEWMLAVKIACVERNMRMTLT